jgi:glucose/arabinose dehydrogenase
VRRATAGLAVLAFLAAPGVASAAVTLPPGFRTEHVVQGPFDGEPVGFAFLPDERILLIERATGNVRLAKVGASSSHVLLRIPDVNGAAQERGLLGVAVDPAWPARPHLYFHYTHADSFSRIVMYTASGDLDDSSSTDLSLADPYFLLTDVRDSSGVHNGGTLRFGPDGMLYASFGDDATSCSAQELESPLGKILRLDPSALPGVGPGPPAKATITPADNPFPAAGDWGRLVWSWGHRNPFRFTIDPVTGDAFVGDVGWRWFEEIDVVPAAGTGLNYGWPQLEADRPVTEFGDCGAGREFTAPIVVLAHGVPPISIVGGPVYRAVPGRAGSFPPGARGNLFFLEFFSGDIHRLRRRGSDWSFVPGPGRSDSVWASGFPIMSDFQEGPDGALWLLAMGFGNGLPAGLHRISSTRTVTAAPFPDDLRVQPNPTRDGATIVVPAGSDGDWSLSILSVDGRRVRTISGSRAPPAVVHWDGRTDRGSTAAAGVYALELRVSDRTFTRGRVTLLR